MRSSSIARLYGNLVCVLKATFVLANENPIGPSVLAILKPNACRINDEEFTTDITAKTVHGA